MPPAPLPVTLPMNDTAPTIAALGQPLALPCGVVLRNRLMKSAMSEVLGSPTHSPTPALARLYGRWAAGGAGLLVTGNVMIDRNALGEPGNVVVEDDRDLDLLRAWAAAGANHDTQLWMQLNHPGKQAPKFLNKETVSPSAVGFGPRLSPAFAVPRALTEPEIEDLIGRFGNAAAVARTAGFTGVQIHGAHGYLVSQFLSPHHNQRTDGWGGSLENRARFVREVYAEIRRRVGDAFPVSIKINSADFQRGGFSEEESQQVIAWLGAAGMDLVEVSGGTYEAPAMTGAAQGARTAAREGYFLAFVETVRRLVDVPVAVTGGFRTAEGMAAAIATGSADVVGLARALAIQPDLPGQVLAGAAPASLVRRVSTGIKALDLVLMLDVTWYENQLARMGRGEDPEPEMGAWASAFHTLRSTGLQAFKARRAKG